MHFSAQEEAQLKETITGLETKTGVQVLVAVVGKADAYPEAPWRAFALAASISALILAARALLDPPWIEPLHAVLHGVTVLGIGAAAALATTLLPPVARWFVGRARREAEVLQYAQAFFLDHEVFRTRGRTGILVLVALFERRVVILPDSGVAARITRQTFAQIVARMTPRLARGAPHQALLEGLAALEGELLAAGFTGAPGTADEIPDELIQEKGARK